MGIRATIGDFVYEVIDYSVQEGATPIGAGDSSGQVGVLSITLRTKDQPELSRDEKVGKFTPILVLGRSVRLDDSSRGHIIGSVTEVSEQIGGHFTVTCTTSLGRLNVYDVRAKPFNGTLGDAVRYYASLARASLGLVIYPSLESRVVALPGFMGELWFHLKQLAVAENFELVLVSGVILARPVRSINVSPARATGGSISIGGTRAQYVEVNQYRNRKIENELVYPPGGWSQDVPVFTLRPGQTLWETLELSASVESVIQPEYRTFVARNEVGQSVFTCVGDDGLPLTKDMWEKNGGRLYVDIGSDTKTLRVRITAPTRLVNAFGNSMQSYSIALASSEGGDRYSTLRILGSGVGFDPIMRRIPTGVRKSQTGTEVGETVDNPFISSTTQAYRAGLVAASSFTGRTINGNLSTADASSNFGEVAGGRVFSKAGNRWMRVRDASITRGSVSMGSLDNDTTYGDIQGNQAGRTWGETVDWWKSFSATYGESISMGVPSFE